MAQDVKIKIEQLRDEIRRHEYNNHRPHSSLGYRTPADFAAGCIASATPSPQQYKTEQMDNSLIACGT